MINGFFAIDYQVHSLRSHDGQATIRDQCLRAIEIGLDEIGFSEHKDFDPQESAVGYFDYALYRNEIERAREEFGCALNIRLGVEIDYQRWFENEIRDFLAIHAFDFVIGSVHYVDGQMLMTPEYNAGKTVEEAYQLYFDAVADSVRSGLIDIVGHLEYANRRGVPAFGPYNPTPYRDQVAGLFGEMVRCGVALEINTAGLRQGVGHTYPCSAHVQLYASLGGKLLSVGSDSHDPHDLGAFYKIAAELALSNGIEEVCVWQDRNPTLIPLRMGE